MSRPQPHSSDPTGNSLIENPPPLDNFDAQASKEIFRAHQMGNVISTIDKDLHSGSKSSVVPADSPGLQILGISPNSATLNWTTVDTATQYQVLYQVNGTATWNNYTTTSKNAAVVTGLVSATTYNFSLSASNTYGTGAPSVVTGCNAPQSRDEWPDSIGAQSVSGHGVV